MLYQPFQAFLAGMLSLSLYELTRGLLRGSGARLLVASVAAQAATLYAYAMWGAIKEMVAAAMLPLLAALACELRHASGRRALVPLAVTGSALLATLSVGAIVWIVALTLPVLLVGADCTRALRGARCA